MLVSLKMINIHNIEELTFMYECRTHPDVDSCLTGPAPENFEKHRAWVSFHAGFDRDIFIVRDDQYMFGYVQIYNFIDDSCEVGFVIHPRWHGLGIGKLTVLKTLDFIEEFIPEVSLVKLEVLKSNTRAIVVYEKNGFAVDEILSSDNTYVMTKRIDR